MRTLYGWFVLVMLFAAFVIWKISDESLRKSELMLAYSIGKYCGGVATTMIMLDPINNAKSINYYADSILCNDFGNDSDYKWIPESLREKYEMQTNVIIAYSDSDTIIFPQDSLEEIISNDTILLPKSYVNDGSQNNN